MRWVTAQDLQTWAGRIEAEAKLPELVRRLVHASTTPELISFPAGESIQTPGWDGIVQAPTTTTYVPQGWSGWELSKRADTTNKANEDYQNRIDHPQHLDPTKTAFIFVTPRRWNTKEDWIAEKKALGQRKDIRAYDADDLEQWLERAPAVGAWLAKLLHKYPNGVLDVRPTRGKTVKQPTGVHLCSKESVRRSGRHC